MDFIEPLSLIVLGYFQFGGNGLVRGKITEKFPDGSFALKFANGRKFKIKNLSRLEEAW